VLLLSRCGGFAALDEKKKVYGGVDIGLAKEKLPKPRERAIARYITEQNSGRLIKCVKAFEASHRHTEEEFEIYRTFEPLDG
jgi:hypothetical protein